MKRLFMLIDTTEIKRWVMWYYDDSLPETLTNEELKQFCNKKSNEYIKEYDYEYEREIRANDWLLWGC
jgi:hypothetical protein